jgi:hypothetical protein
VDEVPPSTLTPKADSASSASDTVAICLFDEADPFCTDTAAAVIVGAVLQLVCSSNAPIMISLGVKE